MAVESIAPEIGFSAQPLLTRVKRREVDSGQREGPTTSERERIEELEGEPRVAPSQRQPAHGQRFFRAGGARPQIEVVSAYIERQL